MVFDHCNGNTAAVWDTFYHMACMCHPAQGGMMEDMRALCRMAASRLGPEWPPEWDDSLPNIFDIFCRATGKPNPFGNSIAPPASGATAIDAAPVGYSEPEPFAAWVPSGGRAGRVWLVSSA